MGLCHSLIFRDTVCPQVFSGIGALATSENKSFAFGCFQFIFCCQFLSKVKEKKKKAEFQKHLNATNSSPEQVLLLLVKCLETVLVFQHNAQFQHNSRGGLLLNACSQGVLMGTPPPRPEAGQNSFGLFMLSLFLCCPAPAV